MGPRALGVAEAGRAVVPATEEPAPERLARARRRAGRGSRRRGPS